MATCPYCDGRMSPQDIDQGRCSHCGAAFFPDAELEGVDTASHTAQTRDSADRSSMPVEPSEKQDALDPRAELPAKNIPLTIDSLHKDQTIDSVAMPPDALQTPPTESCKSREVTGTLDSGSGAPTLPEDKPGERTYAGVRHTQTLVSEHEPGQSGEAIPGLAPSAISDAEVADLTKRVSTLWSGTYQSDATPRTSIKSKFPDRRAEFQPGDSAPRLSKDQGGQEREGRLRSAPPAWRRRHGRRLGGTSGVDRPPGRGQDAQAGQSERRAARQKFLSEAVVTGDLDHPNIVPIYDLGADDSGALFYSMKRVKGTPWNKVIERNNCPGEPRSPDEGRRRGGVRPFPRRHPSRPEAREHHARRLRRSARDGLGRSR